MHAPRSHGEPGKTQLGTRSLHEVLLLPSLFLIYTFLQSKRLVKDEHERKTGDLIRSMAPAVNDTGNDLRKCSYH